MSLCLLFFDELVYLGNWGFVIGFAISVTYFGLQNSHLCKGQTIGKKLFKIKTIHPTGNYLSVSKSITRAIIISPLIFTNIIISLEFIHHPAIIAITTLVSFFQFAIALLFLINTPSRQSLHDIIINTVVVSNDCEDIEITKSKKPAIVIISVFSIVVAFQILGLVFFQKFISEEDFSKIKIISHEIAETGEGKLTIFKETTVITSENQKNIGVKTLTLNLVPYGNNDNEFIANISKKILEEYPNIDNFDYINIDLVRQANIGYGRIVKGNHYSFTPATFNKSIETKQ